MLENLNRTRGLVFSQRLMLALLDKGLLREQAYHLVQSHAMCSWQENQDFKELVLGDSTLSTFLSPQEIEGIFNYEIYTAQVDFIFKRCGLG